MKTEEEFLMNHMYLKGYTDDEMHDPAMLDAERSSLSFRMKFAAYVLKEIAIAAVKAFKKWAANVVDSLRPFAGEPRGNSPLNKYKNPTIPITMTDQVIDRKPRHLTRKIIH